MNVLLVNPRASLPADIHEYLLSKGYKVEVSEGYRGALAQTQTSQFDALVISAPADPEGASVTPFEALLRTVDLHGPAAIVVGDPRAEHHAQMAHLVDFASPDVSKEEIKGRLTMLLQYQRVVRTLEQELDDMQRLFHQLNVQLTEVDQEMRLAGRLQNAFLPGNLRLPGQISFATLYRPATFVSGDIYDICRVDEEHIAFYVADAVGHGMAASLLTMFIKNAIVSKKVYDNRYERLEPGETLQMLNRKLYDQQLPYSQFVTACYAMINLRTLELRYARAGHPYPILCAKDGIVSELKSPGGLLGVFEEDDFPTQRMTLHPGEKLILYSDGLEVAFAKAKDRTDETRYYRHVFQQTAALPPDQLVNEFARLVDREAGSLNPKDDITLVVMQVND